RFDVNNASTISSLQLKIYLLSSTYSVHRAPTRPESYGFRGGGFGVRQEGGYEGVTGFRSESSGLEIPTRRNSFPMTRTMGRIFHLSNVKPTLFLMDDPPPRTDPYLQAR